MNQPDDIRKWIPLALEGDRNAFFEIYNDTIQGAAKLVYTLIYDKSQKDDILQEIYLELYKSLPKFRMSESFRPWFTGIVIRQTKASMRKSGLLHRLKNKQLEQRIETADQDFSDQLVDKLNQQELIQDLNSLSFKLKSVIALRYLSDYSQNEIAQILQLPIGTVRSRISYGLTILRKSMEKREEKLRKVGNYEF